MSGRRAYPQPPSSTPGQYGPGGIPHGGQSHPMPSHPQYPSMMPPGTSLAGPSGNMMPSQSSHQQPAMFNPTATAGYGAQLQGQPPSMTSVNRPPQGGILPPPPSNTGAGSLLHQLPPPPKAGGQPTVGQPLQQLPTMPNQFPHPPSVGTRPPVGLPPQQVTAPPPKTGSQAVGPNQQTPVHSVPMTDQLQPHVGAMRQSNRPPIMSTMAGPPLQTSNANQFSGQTTVGTVQAVPPTMSTQKPPPPVMSAQQPPPMMSSQQPPPMMSSQQPPPVMSAQQPPQMMSAQQPPPVMSSQQPPPVMSSQQPPVMSSQQPPPMVSTQQPVPNITANTVTGGPPMLGMPSSNIRPPRGDYMSASLSGPPLSTGTAMPPPPGPTGTFTGVPHQQPMGHYQQRLPPPPQSSAPPPPPPSGGAVAQTHSALLAGGKRVYPSAGPVSGQNMGGMPGMPTSHAGMAPGQGAIQGQMGMASGPMNPAPPPGQVGMAPDQMGVAPMQMGGMTAQMGGMTAQMGGMTLNQTMLPSLQPVNLLEVKNILPADPVECQNVDLPAGMSRFSPHPKVMCSTINAVPETQSLLGKLKLPLGIHIHPYQSLSLQECPVLQPRTIIRCRVCRTYLNPFVSFIDSRHWRCNLCFRPNDLPEEIGFNPQTKRINEKCRRPELLHSSVEYIAPSEYMVRPPQPSIYYFLIDVSYNSIQTGMLGVFCSVLLDNLSKLPGDARTMVGFLTYDKTLHFYNLKSSLAQPQMMVVTEIDDVFLPSPNSLLVNLRESKELVQNLLEEIPKMFAHNQNTDSALGAALQVGYKLLHPYGGRITVLQTTIPNVGPGALKFRDDDEKTTSQGKEKLTLSPSSDYYKKLALDCSAQQIGVDLFLMSSRYSDLTTIACIAKFSSGQIFYFPHFHVSNATSKKKFEQNLQHYLTRRIGFEAVMRIRCTQGLALHTFHGNFFVRSTDLLSLPNVNPDMSYAFNVVIEESMKDVGTACVQAALLYTSSNGERRIRVHTLALPVTDKLSELYSACNITAIVGLLGKMAVDRVTSASLGDAREALVNAVVDATKVYRSNILSTTQQRLFCLPQSLQLLPIFVLALLKNPAFSLSPKVTLDYRTHIMNLIKTIPLDLVITYIYPKLYGVHSLTEKDVVETKERQFAKLPILQLNSQYLTRQGIYIMDAGLVVYIWIAKAAPQHLITQLFDVASYEDISEEQNILPALDNPFSETVHVFIKQIKTSRPFYTPVHVVKEDSPNKILFIESLLEDRTESTMAYHEFLTFIQKQLEK